MSAPDCVAYNGVAAAAEATGLRPHHIRQAIANGELKVHAVAKRTIILRSSLEEYISRRPRPKSSRARYNEEVCVNG